MAKDYLDYPAYLVDNLQEKIIAIVMLPEYGDESSLKFIAKGDSLFCEIRFYNSSGNITIPSGTLIKSYSDIPELKMYEGRFRGSVSPICRHSDGAGMSHIIAYAWSGIRLEKSISFSGTSYYSYIQLV